MWRRPVTGRGRSERVTRYPDIELHQVRAEAGREKMVGENSPCVQQPAIRTTSVNHPGQLDHDGHRLAVQAPYLLIASTVGNIGHYRSEPRSIRGA